MGFKEILENTLFLLRVGSNPNFIREVERVFTPANTQPTSGDGGRGTAFGATGPATDKEEIALWKRSKERDEPPTFSGL